MLEKLLRIILAITLTGVTYSGFCKEAVNVLVYPDYPPYLYKKNDVMVGLYIDIVGLTFDAIEQPYKLTMIPLQRAINMAARGKGVVVGILKTPERAQRLIFSKPFYQERVVVFSNINETSLIENFEQLEGLQVGTIFGWSYGPEFDQARLQKRFLAVDGDVKNNFRLLAAGRLEAVLHTELSSQFIIQHNGYQSILKASSKPFHYADVHIAVGKNSSPSLLEQFDRQMAQAEHKLKVQQLVDSYRN